jgi:bacterioferritin-associated ferredoxin
VGAACDPVSGQPEFKATAVTVRPQPTAWHGLLLRRDYFTAVAQISAALRAGTNCGSCLTELAAILSETRAAENGSSEEEPTLAAG